MSVQPVEKQNDIILTLFLTNEFQWGEESNKEWKIVNICEYLGKCFLYHTGDWYYGILSNTVV
jgi:hypothetical protein